MAESSHLNLNLSPREFFKDHVSAAIYKQKINVDVEVEFYLVNLLCNFIEPAKAGICLEDQSIFDIPLALQLKNALEAPLEKQPKIYKNLADTSLYVAGYFQDYFNRKAFDIEYFVTLGSNAYLSLGNLIREREDGLSSVYYNLSEQFKEFVEVYAIVSDQLGLNGPTNLLSTYDRWIKNQNSERLRRKLEDNGIIPIPQLTKIAQ